MHFPNNFTFFTLKPTPKLSTRCVSNFPDPPIGVNQVKLIKRRHIFSIWAVNVGHAVIGKWAPVLAKSWDWRVGVGASLSGQPRPRLRGGLIAHVPLTDPTNLTAAQRLNLATHKHQAISRNNERYRREYERYKKHNERCIALIYFIETTVADTILSRHIPIERPQLLEIVKYHVTIKVSG